MSRAARVVLGLAVLLALACTSTRPITPSALRGPEHELSLPVPPPSDLLRLLRSERLAASPQPVSEPEPDPESELDPTTDTPPTSEDDDVREIIIETPKLATFEDLARYTIRNAEARRPRMLYNTRLLLRQSGPIRGAESAHAAARAVLRAARAELIQCLVDGEARRPEVLVEAPAALVLEQSPEGLDYVRRFRITLDPEAGPRIIDSDSLDAQIRTCMVEILSQHPAPTAAAEIPLVAFMQRPHVISASGVHQRLAHEAARLGWMHLERGDAHEAREYFRDAHWVFHLAEYRVLIGLAEEALGDRQAAAQAYRHYVDAWPEACDAPKWQRRIVELTR